ncbi:hypothetical protein ACFO1B_00070 [Dactylosporangium siamense]|uniref:Uncharacterized protein n=1 Tax=Dactylosporangium siamense TaxID=685454 RepID=A0A919PF58_9ACTN|nr:hypothetical protein [Dactylosporangium siamense]GIG42257.1 hypothetical protein Dsi01nite_002980 [Dactylosporangium siamense]
MTDDPVVAALLRRLVELRPASDPLHGFATTVLSGEATLRVAAGHPAFAEAFTDAATEAATEAAALRRRAADQEAG